MIARERLAVRPGLCMGAFTAAALVFDFLPWQHWSDDLYRRLRYLLFGSEYLPPVA